jgi:hypothetical protein
MRRALPIRPFRAAVLALLCASGLCAVACSSRPPEPLEPEGVTWTTYTDEELGFSLRHPSAWTPRRHQGTVVFVAASGAPMRVSLRSREEARRRGYWGRNEPVSTGQRGQTAGELFRYRHFDGPIFDPFLTWVVPHRGLELAVELYTRNQELDSVQSAIVDSLVLASP